MGCRQEAKLEKYAPDNSVSEVGTNAVWHQCDWHLSRLLNSDYVRHGELDIQQLFVVNDMKEMVENEYLKVQAPVNQAMNIINSELKPEVELSECCMKPH